MCVSVCVCVCVCACVRACVRAYVCVCVCLFLANDSSALTLIQGDTDLNHKSNKLFKQKIMSIVVKIIPLKVLKL